MAVVARCGGVPHAGAPRRGSTGSVRLAPERKQTPDAVRIATDSTLARLVSPHYARTDD